MPKRKESGGSQVLRRRRGNLDKVRGREFEVFGSVLDRLYGTVLWTGSSEGLADDAERSGKSLGGRIPGIVEAQGNPWIESLWGRMKVESESLIHQAQTLEEPQQTIDERFEYYNRRRRHSSIGYKRPQECAKERLKTEENIDPDS